MMKKVGLGVAAAIILIIVIIAVTVFASERGRFSGLPKDIRTIFKGILTPKQISTLMDFRRNHAEDFHRKADKGRDLVETWKDLGLTEEQQRQLVSLAADLAEKTNPYLLSIIETGNQLKRKVIESSRDHASMNKLSRHLGEQIGEIAWNLALVRGQARLVLTPKQFEILEQRHSRHDLRMEHIIQNLPVMAEDLADLWGELKLTPNQVDALEAALRLITKTRQDRYVKLHDEWRTTIAKILTPVQLTIADRFHEKQMSEGGWPFLKMRADRERFHSELGLTGEQKIRFVQIVLDHRASIVPSVQEVMNAAGNLRDQVHADIPDRSAVMAAAARLGNAIGQVAEVGTEITTDAKDVLTIDQMNLIKGHTDDLFALHLEHARNMPAKLHELIDFLNELSLSPEQKDQVVKLIAERHEARRVRHHRLF